MDCLRLPTSVEDANAIISLCAGTADWRPLFLTGLGTAAVFLLLLTLLIQGVRSALQ